MTCPQTCNSSFRHLFYRYDQTSAQMYFIYKSIHLGTIFNVETVEITYMFKRQWVI